MSGIKCPFCQQELRNCCAGVIYTCSKPDSCPHAQCYGSKGLWQEFIRTKKQLETTDLELDQLNLEKYDIEDELERTRKALELAITGLKNCKTRDHIGAVCRTPEYVDKILEQIKTALGQNNDIKGK